MICKRCDKPFPARLFIEGKEYTFYKRKYCLDCSPLGTRRLCGPDPKYYKKGEKPLEPLKIDRTCTKCDRLFNYCTATNVCSTCKNRRQRNTRKQKAVTLLGGRCKICGYNKSTAALDFHHKIKAEKIFTLSANWEKPWELLQNELLKCDLLCRNCHAELHQNELAT